LHSGTIIPSLSPFCFSIPFSQKEGQLLEILCGL
jgi:hypothetical protein